EEREASRRQRQASRSGRSVTPRDGWLERARQLTAARRDGSSSPAPARRPGAGPRLPVALGVGVLGVLVAWFLIALFQPFGGDGHGRLTVVIPKRSGVGKS